MGQSISSASFAGDTELGRVVDTPECCAATQRVFDGLQKQSDRNLMKFKRKSTKS